MTTIRVTAEITEDRRVEIVLPPDTPLGPVELTVSIGSEMPEAPKPRKASLAEWAKQYAEDMGDDVKSTDVEGFTGRRF